MSEYVRRLPHYHPDGAYLFITWRLWGSLPASLLASRILGQTEAQHFAAQDRLLDRWKSGPRWLADSRIAGIVADSILAGEQQHGWYELRAWVVMPNHVHVLILPRVSVPEITRWVKGSSARRANQLLERTGKPFWQDESYDHWIRDDSRLNRTVRYIERNPVVAGLCDAVELWPWSSAGWQAKAPAPPWQAKAAGAPGLARR